MGTDRYASRDLADILLTQIQKDIRSSYNLLRDTAQYVEPEL